MEQATTPNGMKRCHRCGNRYHHDMFRRDPQKKDGRYPSCRGCTAKDGWASLIKVIRRVPCKGCGRYFTPRHNKGREVKHCSRSCGVKHRSWANEANAMWGGDEVSYAAAHDRVRRTRGRASQFQCVDCGQGAAHWSLDRDSQHIRFENGMPYSTDRNDYQPRCVPCHKRYDLDSMR